MNTKGVNRKIDNLGRLVIPIEIRKTLNITETTHLDIKILDDKIVVEKIKHDCIICSKTIEEKKYIDNSFVDLICEECIKRVADFYNITTDKRYIIMNSKKY